MVVLAMVLSGASGDGGAVEYGADGDGDSGGD